MASTQPLIIITYVVEPTESGDVLVLTFNDFFSKLLFPRVETALPDTQYGVVHASWDIYGHSVRVLLSRPIDDAVTGHIRRTIARLSSFDASEIQLDMVRAPA